MKLNKTKVREILPRKHKVQLQKRLRGMLRFHKRRVKQIIKETWRLARSLSWAKKLGALLADGEFLEINTENSKHSRSTGG